MYDLAWSEIHENQIASACGDGSIKLWDVSLNVRRLYAYLQDHPIRNWAEHTREVFSLDWNNIQKELFASSSWDGAVKVVRGASNPSGTPTVPRLSERFRRTVRVYTSVPGRRAIQACWRQRREMVLRVFLTCVWAAAPSRSLSLPCQSVVKCYHWTGTSTVR